MLKLNVFLLISKYILLLKNFKLINYNLNKINLSKRDNFFFF